MASTSGPPTSAGRVIVSRQTRYSLPGPRSLAGVSSAGTGVNCWCQRPGTTWLSRCTTDWAPRNAATCAPAYCTPLSVTLVMARKPIAPGANGRRSSSPASACVRAGVVAAEVGVSVLGLGMLCSLLVQGTRVKRWGPRLSGVELRFVGGACARLVVRCLCARAPSLTSVRDPRVGSGAGDMMFDGVIPLGEALRPLGLSGPSTG